MGAEWAPPVCTGWKPGGFSTLVVVAARFRHASGAKGLLRRIGAISGHVGIRYWSATRKRWQRLIKSAGALTGPEGSRPRKDFQPEDLREGKVLYFRQEDNLLGDMVYRLQVRTSSPDRLVFATENISPVRRLLVTLLDPGEIQALHFLERESQDVWRYYGIMRTGQGVSVLTSGHKASFANRAAAYYRYMAGIPTDKEPPAWP
jgi:hypothetical protein